MSTGIAPQIILDPAARAFLDALAAAGGPPIFTLSPSEARGVLDRLQSGDTAMSPAAVEPTPSRVGPAARSRLPWCGQKRAMGVWPRSCTSTVVDGCWATSARTSD